MRFATNIRISRLKRLPFQVRTRGLVYGIRFWLRDLIGAFEKCADCGKSLWRFTDTNSAGSHGAIGIDVGGHKKTISLCWLCYHKNK